MLTSSDLRKRCRCTGETPNEIRRQRGGGHAGPLVPVAGPGQQRFEAGVLQAVVRAMARMRRRGHPLRPTALVDRVRLDSPVVGLRVHDTALDHLLAEVLPVLSGDRLRGVPGLRAHPGRDHLDLRAPDGEVRLLGVTRKRWRQAVEAGLPAGPPPVEPVHRTSSPTAVMSGVLRRLPLWRGAAWLDGVVVGDALELYWRNGPPADAVAAILTRSTCAVPDTAAVPYAFRNTVRGVALTPAPTPTATEPEDPKWAWNHWLATTAPGAALHERAVRPRRPATDLPDVWDQPEMRAALALRRIDTVYRLLLRHGVQRHHLATLTGQSPHEVDAVLAGGRVESYDALTDIAEALGVPPGYMGLAHDERPAHDTPCDCEALDERAKRDRFLAHAALVTVGAVPGTWGCRSETCATRATP
ncbi:hypothetical protein [Saccharothrix sp. Mg75]|uniref:hypothetical protein n=1 Tax=Saccharothrix sp. Mg75 TaxID=3445357 RepID=UPI003EEFCBDC